MQRLASLTSLPSEHGACTCDDCHVSGLHAAAVLSISRCCSHAVRYFCSYAEFHNRRHRGERVDWLSPAPHRLQAGPHTSHQPHHSLRFWEQLSMTYLSMPMQGSTSNVTKESGMGASALQLTECELDLTPSSSHFIPHALHDMASKASLANSGSLALRMTDNRFITQPAFEESLRATPNSSKLKRHGQLLDSSEQLALRPDQASGRGVPKHGAWRSDQASPQTAKQGAVQARRKSPFSKLGRLAASNTISAYSAVPLGGHGKLHSSQSVSNSAAKSSVSQHVIASMQSAPAQPLRPPSSTSMHTQKHEQSNALGDALSLSRGKAQVSPQPKQSVLKNKLQPIRSEGSAEQPPKRVKYDHLLSGNALLSIAGRNRKK